MEKEFDNLIANLKKCEICKNKFGFNPHPIFLGNINSKIVQISQAPSATVHETLKPFTDQSGKKLKYEWYQISDDIFYNPNNFYNGINYFQSNIMISTSTQTNTYISEDEEDYYQK